MRMLGLLGGMSWESTAEYYRLINRGYAERRGGLHSAPLLLHSFDFARIAELQRADDWKGAGDVLADAAAGLERAGATALMVCTNTMHHVADAIERAVSIPLLHIVDPTGAALRDAGVRRAGLLGTRFSMEFPFWRERLAERFGVETIIPEEADRALVHRVIFDELCLGRVVDSSRGEYLRIIDGLRGGGAEAVILGCTEIPLLIAPGQGSLPGFDTTALHARAAVGYLVDGTLGESSGGGLASR
jgi:aspartate racemase